MHLFLYIYFLLITIISNENKKSQGSRLSQGSQTSQGSSFSWFQTSQGSSFSRFPRFPSSYYFPKVLLPCWAFIIFIPTLGRVIKISYIFWFNSIDRYHIFHSLLLLSDILSYDDKY